MSDTPRSSAYHEDDPAAWSPSPVATAGNAFALLSVGPDPVTVDGCLFDYLPDREVAVDELRELLLARDCPRRVWDQVWAHVIIKSRWHGATWTLVAVGLALPMLSRICEQLTVRFAGDPHDIHAEVLRGFLDALSAVDLDQGRIVIRLRWAAYRAGHKALVATLDGPTPVPSGFGPSEPPPPFGHPDLVLARAVETGVLSRYEAELIGDTRLQGISLADWAAVHNLSYAQVQRGRHRAEHRLAVWIRARLAGSSSDHGDDPGLLGCG